MKEIRHKNGIDVIQILPYLNLSWRMGWRIYGGERIQMSLNSLDAIDPQAQGPG